MAVDSPGPASSTTLLCCILHLQAQDFTGKLAHVEAAHSVAGAQTAEALGDLSQYSDVLLQVAAEVMRVPPQMKNFAAFGSMAQSRLDALHAQPLKKSQPSRVRTQEPAGPQIQWRVCAVRRKRVVPSQVDVCVQEPS